MARYRKLHPVQEICLEVSRALGILLIHRALPGLFRCRWLRLSFKTSLPTPLALTVTLCPRDLPSCLRLRLLTSYLSSLYQWDYSTWNRRCATGDTKRHEC